MREKSPLRLYRESSIRKPDQSVRQTARVPPATVRFDRGRDVSRSHGATETHEDESLTREHPATVLLGLLAAAFAAFGYGARFVGPNAYVPAPRDPAGLRVVTWNVGGRADRGHPLSASDLPHVADVLRTLDADLLALQELAGHQQCERLCAALGPAWQCVTGTGGRRRVAVLWSRGRVRPWREAVSGAAALLLTYHPSRGAPLLLANLHADPLSARKRNRLVGRVMDALDPARATIAVLLAGDLNLDVDPGSRRDLFTDDAHLDVETYNYLSTRLSDAAARGGSTAEPDRRLDYIFFDATRLDVTRSGPWKGQRSGDMDHDPVVADLRFRRSP